MTRGGVAANAFLSSQSTARVSGREAFGNRAVLGVPKPKRKIYMLSVNVMFAAHSAIVGIRPSSRTSIVPRRDGALSTNAVVVAT